MALTKIAFENLRAEMGRKQLTISNIANSIGMSRETLGRKFSREAPLKLDEAFLIVNTFFPNEDVEYIFKEAASPDDQKPA